MQKKVVVVLYEYFFPGYKAGGPIQSLVNMVVALQDSFTFKVITTGFDLNETAAYSTISVNEWNTIVLQPQTEAIQVWYSSTSKIEMHQMHQLLTDANPDYIFVNGLFTSFFSQPLWLLKTGKLHNVRVIVSPRGMLQKGALQVKPLRKKIYLQLFKTAGLFKNIDWHATNASELQDVYRLMGNNSPVCVAANVPKLPLPSIELPNKINGHLRLVYLSIITPKKNLLLLLQQLSKLNTPISLTIYGPIKEPVYWEQCLIVINQLPANITVQYMGDVQPQLVQSTIAQYDALISLTAGENFGHALYESLSSGRPIITSYFTPWNELEKQTAGWNVDINNNENIQLLLQQIAMMDTAEFAMFCKGAWQMSKDYYHQSNFHKNYCTLFSS